jgi:tetratricopeptide (TPR) repeat protein
MSYILLGDLTAARKALENGIGKFKEMAAAVAQISGCYGGLSNVYYELGEYEKAQAYAEKALELSKSYDQRHWEGYANIWLGRILVKRNSSEVDHAEALIQQGIQIFGELKLRTYCTWAYFFLGELYANAGRREEGLESLNKAMNMCREMGMKGYWQEMIQEVLDRI